MQTQINEIVESAIANLTKAAEVNTIVGKPILALDGTTILPISQITFAFMAGGGATMKPIGFLVVGDDGVEMVTIDADSTFDKILDIAKSFTKRTK